MQLLMMAFSIGTDANRNWNKKNHGFAKPFDKGKLGTFHPLKEIRF
jgi:hypothetical protein